MTRLTRAWAWPLMAALAPFLVATPAAASTQNGEAQAVVLRPLSLVATEELDFGNIVRGATAGTVTINATSNARTATGGVTLAGGSPHAAGFQTLGLFNTLFLISVPSGTTTLSNGSGASMTVTDWTQDGNATRFFPSGGVVNIRVGGQLNVGANQAPGNYTGTFSLTVIYL